MPKSSRAALLLVPLVPLLLLVAGRLAAAPADVLPLASGKPVRLTLDPRDEDPPAYRVVVPRRATALHVRTNGATADVDLYVRRGRAPVPYEGLYDAAGPGIWLDEELLVDVTDAVPLEPGNWYVTVLARDDRRASVSCELVAEVVEPRYASLPLGTVVDAQLERERGYRAAYVVELPRDLAADARLRIEVESPAADVDVLAGPRGNVLDAPYHAAWTPLAYERFELAAAELADGLALHVFAYPAVEDAPSIAARVLVVRADDERSLCPPAVLPEVHDQGRFSAAMAATVAVFGPLGAGSGVVVSPDGWIVSNAHVVVGARANGDARPSSRHAADSSLAEVGIGFHGDARRPVAPAFGAELVDVRRDLDLALLRIVSTLDRRPLVDAPRFPCLVPATEDDAPRPGDPVYGLGYPMTGGAGSLVTITLTRGIHSGYAPEAHGLLIKTDAATHAGVSGGACVDERGRLVGFPSSTITDSNLAGGLGFVIPLAQIPAAWRELVGW